MARICPRRCKEEPVCCLLGVLLTRVYSSCPPPLKSHQVDGLDVVLLDCIHVCGVAADGQDTTVHTRVQRLDTTCAQVCVNMCV